MSGAVGRNDVTGSDPVLVYDGRCGVCSASRRFVQRNATRPLVVVPFQADELGTVATRVERARARRAVTYQDSAGRVYEGAAAVGHVLLRLGPGCRLLGRVLLLPPITRVAQLGYEWVATHRGRVSRWLGAAGVDVTPDL